VVQFADAMSHGDMTRSMDAGTQDEVGRLIRALNTMSANVRKTVSDIQDGVQVLSSSSTELATISTQVASGVRQITDRSTTVAAASEESSAVASSMAASMRDATENLNAIAGAAEELSATIASIASDSERARAVTNDASTQAAVVTATVQDLGRSAHDIGKVTETIADISAQTNLLALNATIEAARAGAAGKGFSVVANEIKELARQTAAATDDIKAKIGSVQSSTTAAIGDIEKIGSIIEQVTSFVNSVTSTIEEQSVAMKDVASRVAHSSQVVRDAGAGADGAAQATRQIASELNSVNLRIGEISDGGRQIETSSSELSNLSERLHGLVSQFSV
jgi:methyl-accepting chemotaxis protein